MNSTLLCFILFYGLHAMFLIEPIYSLDEMKFEPSSRKLQNRIVGGEESPKLRFPYQAAILGQDSNFPSCGGSLITPNVVLCAAHCVGNEMDPWPKRVMLGAHNLLQPERDSREIINIKRVIVHPYYVQGGADVALFVLERNSRYEPVKLVDDSYQYTYGEDMMTVGWGTLSSGGYTSDVLRNVTVDYVPKTICNQMFNGNIRQSMICAARYGRDACQGDSGGPLIINVNHQNGGFRDVSGDRLVGVVSWGWGCADPNYPGVYADVQMVRDWIEQEACAAAIVVQEEKSNVENYNITWDQKIQTRIVGGTIVNDANRYTYQVAIYTQYGSKPMCGGSLIASNVVLCAAHCSGYAFKVKIGVHDVTDTRNTETFTIVQKRINESYGKIYMDADIVLFQLDGNSKYQPIQLISESTYNKLGSQSALWAIGWGRTSYGGSTSNVLRSVDVNYVTNAECQRDYGQTTITKNMICAAAPNKDACQGDSGGPLVVKKKSAAEDELAGCVSFGHGGCANPNYPGVYCNIHTMREWIVREGCAMTQNQGRLCGGTDDGVISPGSPGVPTPAPFPLFVPNPTSASGGLCGVSSSTASPFFYQPKPTQTRSPTRSPTLNCDKLAVGCEDVPCFPYNNGRYASCKKFDYLNNNEKRGFCREFGTQYCPVTCKDFGTRC